MKDCSKKFKVATFFQEITTVAFGLLGIAVLSVISVAISIIKGIFRLAKMVQVAR